MQQPASAPKEEIKAIELLRAVMLSNEVKIPPNSIEVAKLRNNEARKEEAKEQPVDHIAKE